MILRHFVLAAGGTGGHMIPAHALAAELVRRGHRVSLITDARGAKIPGLFEGVDSHVMPAGRITKSPLTWPKGALAILAGRHMARAHLREVGASVVIGFGGYPAYPALLAARSLGIATAVHEQNAVLGRVNRMVAPWVDAIATAYPDVARLPSRAADRVTLVGNPVREEIIDLRDMPYPALTEEGVFRVLVTGGSQGASVLSRVVPDGLSMLPPALARRLIVTQQARVEDVEKVRARYDALKIPAEVETYIHDMANCLNWSHLVIGRAGASTIAELTAAGRPAILIPLPTAMDDHQSANAREMVEAGGARAIPESQFTPQELAKQLHKLGLDPTGLTNAARRAKSCGRPFATRDLANLVEGLAPKPPGRVTVGPSTQAAYA